MVKVNPMTDEDFDRTGGNYFEAGAHVVILEELKNVTPENGSPYVNVKVLGENDEQADIRVYTSEKAAPYTIALFGRIAVHNKATDAAKNKVRAAFKSINDTDQMTDTFLKNLEKMQAWILTEEDKNAPKPNGGYYLRSTLYSWEPTPRAKTSEEQVQELTNTSTPVNDPDEIPFP